MSEPEFIVAIPARYGASRLPGKPLRLIAGEPMVLHVARRALAAGASEVLVSSSQRWALMHELRGAAEPRLPELLAHAEAR